LKQTGIDIDKVNFSHLVDELFRKLNLINRDQKMCHNLTVAQCLAVGNLDKKGMLTMNELSQEQGVTLSAMTRAVNVLVRDGVVQRMSSPGDRRKVCIVLTEWGKKLADILKKCTEDYTDKILAQIPENKRKQTFESMEIILKAIESL
jgi:MarR family transcriptional regulator for hemolysin